ncbi:hypothetical protein AAT17_04530 [Nonlabens sp. MIC269]|nr:hypothetical protein AAT17_04530 [Nonlabens sp. MIC269]
MLLISCSENKNQSKEDEFLKKSFKEKKNEGTVPKYSEEFDPETKIYSNYEYLITIDAPDNWKVDFGTSKHSIFRGNDPELALTFSLVVVEPNTDKPVREDAWEFYRKNRIKLDNQVKTIVKTQMNSEIENYNAEKSYVKNFVSLKQSYDHIVRGADVEYLNHVINHSVYRDEYIYTITIQMPKIIYDEQPMYFERLVNKVSFLPNPDDF